MKMSRATTYDLVISGGGLRCLHSMGFVWQLMQRGLSFSEIHALSAGALVAMPLMSASPEEFVREAVRLAKLHRLFNRKGWKPGESILSFQRECREIVSYGCDIDAIKKSSMSLKFSTLRLPKRHTRWAVLHFYRMARHLEAGIKKASSGDRLESLQSLAYARRLGVEELVFDVADFSDRETLCDAVISSSRIPPLVKPQSHFTDCLDGGLICPLPAHIALQAGSESPLLALCNNESVKRYAKQAVPIILAATGSRIPARWESMLWHNPRRVPVAMWGYGDAKGIQEAFDGGRRAADGIEVVS